MTNQAPIATIFGGSGFLGRYIAQRLARRGWRIRVAVRRPNEAIFVKPYGDVGQVEPIQANIRDEASTRRAIDGADAVINCVGVLFETGRQSFDAVQAEGAARIARLSAECGVRSLVHVSAIGADAGSDSDYAVSKAAGESAVREAFPSAVILRPSIIFGAEDQFFNRFAGMCKITPVLPVVGADTRFQPVHVDDVAEAACRALEVDGAQGRTFELGGPKIYTFRALMELMLTVIRRRRLLLNVPLWAARIKAWFLEKSAWVGIPPLLTRDQVRLLAHDNVVAEDAPGFAELGVTPVAAEAVIPDYLYAYRPYGQYDVLTDEKDGVQA